jgi:hypothetical protein
VIGGAPHPRAAIGDPGSLLAHGWLARALGLRLEVTADPLGGGIDALAGLALRRNPRRAHLLVSRVLGKHLPVVPQVSLAAGRLLADRVAGAEQPGGASALRHPAAAAGLLLRPPRALSTPPLVIGYCETATGLGHAVADGLAGSVYLHSTRRAVPGVAPALAFLEEHSHATGHLLVPEDPGLLTVARPVVLVDDELSTGRTVRNTIRALHALAPHPSYTVATLLDLRSAADRAALAALAAELNTPITVVSLLAGELAMPPDAPARAAPYLRAPPGAPAPSTVSGRVVRLRPRWPAGQRDGGRHGWDGTARSGLEALLPALAAELDLGAGPTLVLGSEELMYLPIRLAAALPGAADGWVLTQSTTRSPVLVLDREGYAVRSALSFPAPDEPGRASYVYNVAPGRYRDIVLVTDGPPAAAVLGALARCAPTVHALEVPSFRPVRPAA